MRINISSIFLLLAVLIYGCSGYSSNQDIKTSSDAYDKDYVRREIDSISKVYYEKGLSFYNYRLYDSVRYFFDKIITSSEYEKKADSLIEVIKSEEIKIISDDIVSLSESRDYGALYDVLANNIYKLKEYSVKRFDSIAYVQSKNILEGKYYEYFGRFFALIDRNSPLKEEISDSYEYEDYKKYLAEYKEAEDLKRKSDEFAEYYPYFALMLEEAQALVNYYNAKLPGKSYQNALEYLYDEGFGRKYTLNGEEFKKTYHYENGYFTLEIDLWFSYGYKRLFYEVMVKRIQFKDKDGRSHTYYTSDQSIF